MRILATQEVPTGHFSGGGQLTGNDDLRDILNRMKRGSTMSTDVVVTDDTTAVAGQRIPWDASGGTFVIYAPLNPIRGDHFGVKEMADDATAITIDGNGNNIENIGTGALVASYTIGQAKVGIEWEFDGTQWIIP